MSSTVVTVKLFDVSPAMNVTLSGTPAYSVVSSPVPGVAVIGTVTVVPTVGAMASVTITWASSPSSTDSDAAANDTATPTIGVTITWASAPPPATFTARTSKVCTMSLTSPVKVWLVVFASLSWIVAQAPNEPLPTCSRYS